jgi:hypothetical protein
MRRGGKERPRERSKMHLEGVVLRVDEEVLGLQKWGVYKCDAQKKG